MAHRARVVVAAALAASTAVVSPSANAEPDDLPAIRLRCRALLEGDSRQRESIAACREAVVQGRSPQDFRFAAAALVRGPALPSPEDLSEAWMLARRAREGAKDQPWGYAAECDIARHLGDRALEASCLASLQRVAPDHEETRRALSLQPKRRDSALWLGWGLLAAGCASTAAHAGYRARRLKRRGVSAVVAAALAFAGATFPASAAAQEALPAAPGVEDFPLDLSNPESSVPPLERQNARPLAFGRYLMELSGEADAALKRGDVEGAARFYRAITKAVPDRSVGFARLCEAYERLGEISKAIESCRDALARSGVTIGDYQRFAGLLLRKPELSQQEVQDVSDVVRHLEQTPATRFEGALIDCELALKRRDRTRFAVCTQILKAVAPNDARTISFSWSRAMMAQDLRDARGWVERARAIGMDTSAIQRMDSALSEAESSRLQSTVLSALAAAAALGASVLALRWWRKRGRTLRTASV